MRFPKYLNYTCIAILSLFPSCSKNSSEMESPPEQHEEESNIVELTSGQMKNAGILTGKVEQRQISGTIRVNGKLDVPPQQLVSISAPLGGFLKSTPLLQGSRVKKGQLIASIENLDFVQIQQDYLEAKSQYDLTRADYDRQQQLAKENVNSQKTLQQSQSNYRTWQAKFAALEAKLKVLNIRAADVDNGSITSTINLYSPINGYVTEVNINIGKFASPTDVIFEIVDTEHLHAELIVFEKDVPKLKIGQKVRFILANESSERMATIYLIGREIGENRTVRIHCHIDKEDQDLLPGMYLSAAVETSAALVPALPDDAVLDYQGKKYVFVVSEDRHVAGEKSTETFAMVEVQVGNSELGYTEVSLADTLKNTPIVIKNGYSLLSQMKNSEGEGGHAH